MRFNAGASLGGNFDLQGANSPEMCLKIKMRGIVCGMRRHALQGMPQRSTAAAWTVSQIGLAWYAAISLADIQRGRCQVSRRSRSAQPGKALTRPPRIDTSKICRSSSMHSGRPLSALFGFPDFDLSFLYWTVSRLSDRAFCAVTDSLSVFTLGTKRREYYG